MSTLVESSSVSYAPVSNTVIYHVDASSGVHKATIIGVNITVNGSNVSQVSYNIMFQNPQLGSIVTTASTLYADQVTAVAAYELLIS